MKTGWLLTLLLGGFALPALACTSAIVSGKATPDGRPLMWKNRDSDNDQNYVAFFAGERYRFIAVADSADIDSRSVWMGTNHAGFCIMNTLSYNLIEKKRGERTSSDNGIVMKRALEVCATVNDFKHFLDTLRTRNVEANFGVIDAQGGAAYFEVDHFSYAFYDVNDPQVAPDGYLVRSNFSVSGQPNRGLGYLRYRQAELLIAGAVARQTISPEYFFTHLSRSFANPLTGTDLIDKAFAGAHESEWYMDQDFIARKKSTSAVVFQGVRPSENPDFTIMWTAIGYPPVTPAVPLWVKGAEGKLPSFVMKDTGKGVSLLCNHSLTLRNKIYAYLCGDDAEKYLKWQLLYNTSGTGYMQRAASTERQLFLYSLSHIRNWRGGKDLPLAEVYALYDWLELYMKREVAVQW